MPRNPNTAVTEELKRQIAAGRYSQSELLPSERRLAEELGVGRAVIRNALQTLQREGVIQLIPRRGTAIVREQLPRRLERFQVFFSSTLQRDAFETIGILSGICVAAADIYAEAVISFPHQGKSPSDEWLGRFLRHELQGIIFMEYPRPEGHIRKLNRHKIPWVVVNQEQDFSSVCCRMDFREIGRTAGRRLLAAGHRNLGVLAGNLQTCIYREMLAGFRGALAEEETILDPANILEVANPANATQAQVRRLAECLRSPRRPTAFFATRDHRAELLYRVCRELGLAIPGDISVIGYDNVSWPAAETEGLSTIRQPIGELGQNAVALLRDWYLNDAPPPSRLILGSLIERHSIRHLAD